MHSRRIFVAVWLMLSAVWGQDSFKVVGYFTSWSIYARGYLITDIPTEYITHINYAFANISPDGTIQMGDAYADTGRYYPGDSWEPDSMRGNFHQLILLRERCPRIRTLISVGGWTWSGNFPAVAATDSSRRRFARSCAEFIDQFQFDGVDIDWEYPIGVDEGHNFTLLMAELRRQLDSLGTVNGKHYLLTAAVSADPNKIAYLEVDSLAAYVDWINLMSYDFHGPWGGEPDAVTNFNAALFPASDDPLPEPYHSQFNQSAAVANYIAAGMPPEKIVLGVPFYGRGYGGVDTTDPDGLFASYSGAASAGTWENGVFDYWDLVENYIGHGYVRYWHDEAKVPWLYNPETRIMISYDDTLSIYYKAQYVVENSLGGVMFWEFSCDRDTVLVKKLYETINDLRITQHSPIPTAVYAYPNPFNSSCAIRCRENSQVEIYDIRGVLVWAKNSGGNRQVVWVPEKDLPAGVYVVVINRPEERRTIRTMFVK